MSQQGDRPAESSPPGPLGRQAQPLVIVSERGRHTEESRRIVRAQAARASAAQSRVTRARNRGEREVTQRDGPQPPSATEQAGPSSSAQASSGFDIPFGTLPLAAWLPSIIGSAAGVLAQEVQGYATAAPSQASSLASKLPSSTPSFSFASPGAGEGVQSPTEASKFQLPLALPRGFSTLQSRIQISDSMLGLLSRTACVDFASPGVEGRLHHLLFDLIANVAGSALATQPGHPIQGHLRVACTCLTIFQGQRANGAVFAHDQKYHYGLEAAWSEATMLDRAALAEPKSAEASLWAVFIIAVTTGATATFFHQQLYGLLNDLQLRYWEQVRKVLLDFIYPVSFIDEPCKSFFHNLQSVQNVQVAAG